MFRVISVDSRRLEALEQLGTKQKFWYADDTVNQNRRMLFKAEQRGTGEDWAEKIACELCNRLGLPHVHYELALELKDNLPGVVCESLAPKNVTLILGNQLLLEHDPEYPVDEKRKYKVHEHTVEAICEVIGELKLPPPPWIELTPPNIKSAMGVFVGYLMLDAWIANQDRHHENWGALQAADAVCLAPTYDHGASLARNISDEERQDRMTSKDTGRQIQTYAKRARSAIYADVQAGRPLTTLGVWAAFSTRAPKASDIWLERLRGIDDNTIRELLQEIPPHRLSNVGREFTLQLLAENRRRLLCGETQ